MALTTCGDCGNQISTSAPACPNCGKPLPKKKSNLLAILIGLGAGLVLALILAYVFIQKQGEALNARSETAAFVNVQTIGRNELLYKLKTGQYGSMSDLISAGLVERSFATENGGYVFRIQSTPTSYVITAHPAHYGDWGKGRLSFYMANDEILRQGDHGGADATASDPRTPVD
jgi:hypothetical protein